MGWVANILIFLGTWLVGRKDRRAFVYTAIGEAVWTGVAVYRGMTDLAVVCAVFGLMALWNYRKWAQDSVKARELLIQESRLNHEGFYLRNDLLLRNDEKWARDHDEGYSLVSFGPFERHHVYGGTRAFAIERAYQEFIIGSNFEKAQP